MRKWTQWQINFARSNRNMKLAYVAVVLCKSKKTVCEFYRKEDLLRIPNYTPQEIYWLKTHSIDECIRLMPYRSANALKIKKWRITRTPACK